MSNFNFITRKKNVSGADEACGVKGVESLLLCGNQIYGQFWNAGMWDGDIAKADEYHNFLADYKDEKFVDSYGTGWDHFLPKDVIHER